MNKDIMRQAGFSKEVKLVEARICPFCKKPIKVSDFRTPLDLKEFGISGLCQTCIDKTFN